jgi:dachs protein
MDGWMMMVFDDEKRKTKREMMGQHIYSPFFSPFYNLNEITDSGEALKRRNNDLCPAGGGGTLRRGAARSSPCNVDDLIHLAGPLTEDAVLKTLQARFYADEFFVRLLLRT